MHQKFKSSFSASNRNCIRTVIKVVSEILHNPRNPANSEEKADIDQLLNEKNNKMENIPFPIPNMLNILYNECQLIDNDSIIKCKISFR